VFFEQVTHSNIVKNKFPSPPIEQVKITNKETGEFVCTVGIDCVCRNMNNKSTISDYAEAQGYDVNVVIGLDEFDAYYIITKKKEKTEYVKQCSFMSTSWEATCTVYPDGTEICNDVPPKWVRNGKEYYPPCEESKVLQVPPDNDGVDCYGKYWDNGTRQIDYNCDGIYDGNQAGFDLDLGQAGFSSGK